MPEVKQLIGSHCKLQYELVDRGFGNEIFRYDFDRTMCELVSETPTSLDFCVTRLCNGNRVFNLDSHMRVTEKCNLINNASTNNNFAVNQKSKF